MNDSEPLKGIISFSTFTTPLGSLKFGGHLYKTMVLSGCAFLSVVFPASAADWPSWGGQPSRNMSSESAKGLPDWYSPGAKKKGDELDLSTARNIKWVAKLKFNTFSSPIVSQGRVFIGTAGESPANARILCLDEETGKELGTFVCGPSPTKTDNFGVCSTPTVEGDRLYFVAPYPEVMCVDLKAWFDPSAGAGAADSARHVAWRYDMAKSLQIMQDHVASCSVLVHGDYVYAGTGNGRFKYTGKPFYPLTPSLIALDKRTGQLVARDDEQIGEQLWRGQWSSPSLATVNGKAQILFATGNGFCYAFEPVDPAAAVVPDRWVTTTLRGPIVYYIDVKGKDTAGLTPAEYAKQFNVLSSAPKPALPLEFRYSIDLPVTTPVDTIPTAKVPDVPILKKIWWFDCLPPEYRNAPFYAHGTSGDGQKHPCDIIATPVFYRNRVYVAIGGDPVHGSKDNKGYLVCIDATRTGDITRSGKVWSYDGMNASSTVWTRTPERNTGLTLSRPTRAKSTPPCWQPTASCLPATPSWRQTRHSRFSAPSTEAPTAAVCPALPMEFSSRSWANRYGQSVTRGIRNEPHPRIGSGAGGDADEEFHLRGGRRHHGSRPNDAL